MINVSSSTSTFVIRLVGHKLCINDSTHGEVYGSAWPDGDYDSFSTSKISDISIFYFPTYEIDGFEMFSVAISEAGFNYYYAPIEKLRADEAYAFSNDDGIEIVIERSDWRQTDAADFMNKIAEGDGNILTEDNFVYSGGNHIFAQIGDTVLRITVGDELANYKYLRELCINIIRTSELVTVQDYKNESGFAERPVGGD